MLRVVILLLTVLCLSAHAFRPSLSRARAVSPSALRMADVEITFPNKKKAKVASGSKMSDAAKKAGYKPNYACEEGKCGSCELKSGGKKVRVPCYYVLPPSFPCL